MKANFLMVVLFVSIFACHNSKEEFELDWSQQIENEISEFEKTKTVLKKGEFIDNGETVLISIFKSKKSSIIKYVSKAVLGELYPMRNEIYLKENKVVYSKWSGLSPYINKGQITKNTKCCAVFENLTYYKSSNEIISLRRKIDLKHYSEYELKKKQLIETSFEEKEVKDAQVYYDRAMQTVEELNQKI